MIKSIGAALAMGMSLSAVHAQSSVTIYGSVDAAFTIGSGGGGASNVKQLDSGVGPGSRLGFRGNEDLGGGLRAVFALEMGFDSGSGTIQQGGAGFGRQSYVGIGGPNWLVTMGRQYGPNELALAAADTMSQIYWGSSSAYGVGSQSPASVAGNGCHGATVRINNSIQGLYTAGPVTGRLMVGAGDENASGSGRFINPSLTYKDGPLMLNAGYARLRQCAPDIPAGATPDWQSEVTMGGSFDFSWAKVSAGYYQWDPSEANKTITGTTNLKQKVAFLGVRVPVGANSVLAQVARLKQSQRGGDATGTSFGITYEHLLSKRTRVYVSAAKVWNDDRARFGLVAGTAAQPATGPGASPRALSLGLTHTF